jgi:DNA-binding NarL/FixJ family response regulator
VPAEQEPERQPYVTLNDAHGYAIETFGQDAAIVYAAILEGQSVGQIAKKLRITEKAVTNISTQLSTRVQALIARKLLLG